MVAGGIHATRWRDYVRDIHRALRPGGWFQSVEIYFTLAAIYKRFTPNTNLAMSAFKHSKLSIQDIADDPEATSQFVQRMLRYARDTAMLNADRSNWHAVMRSIWAVCPSL